MKGSQVQNPRETTRSGHCERRNPDRKSNSLSLLKNMSQLMNIISNEPSLGLYRIQEHIRKSIPKLENQTKKLEDCSTVMKDLNYTMENAQHSIISGTVLITAFTGGTITTADRGRRYNLHKLFEFFPKRTGSKSKIPISR